MCCSTFSSGEVSYLTNAPIVEEKDVYQRSKQSYLDFFTNKIIMLILIKVKAIILTSFFFIQGYRPKVEQRNGY